MTKRPLILGGLMLGAGYLWAMVRRAKRPVSDELVAFRRREQMERLSRLLSGGRSRASHDFQHPPHGV